MDKAALFIACYISTTVTVINSGAVCEERIGKICYSDSSYPHQEIEQFWQGSQTALTNAFGDPNPDSQSVVEKTSKSCVLCPTSHSMKIQPLSILEEGNQKLYIISTKKYPRPQIEVQICKKNTECSIPNLPDDYITRCVQRKSQLNVLAYNTTSKEFVGKAITYPSYCECLLSVYTED